MPRQKPEPFFLFTTCRLIINWNPDARGSPALGCINDEACWHVHFDVLLTHASETSYFGAFLVGAKDEGSVHTAPRLGSTTTRIWRAQTITVEVAVGTERFNVFNAFGKSFSPIVCIGNRWRPVASSFDAVFDTVVDDPPRATRA
jgi:hypothetical protein